MSVPEVRVSASRIRERTYVVAVTDELDLYSAEQAQHAAIHVEPSLVEAVEHVVGGRLAG